MIICISWLENWQHNLTVRDRCCVQLSVLELSDSFSLGVGVVGSPASHGQLPGEGHWVGGVRQTDAHHTRHFDVTVQGNHRYVIDRTDYGARPLPVARVDLDRA